jgi:hypothetical protein
MYVIFSREIALLIFKNLHHKILKLNKKNTISKKYDRGLSNFKFFYDFDFYYDCLR